MIKLHAFNHSFILLLLSVIIIVLHLSPFFSLLRLISPTINSKIPPHSHMIPITVLFKKNHTGDIKIHIIAISKFPALFIIFSSPTFCNKSLFYILISQALFKCIITESSQSTAAHLF